MAHLHAFATAVQEAHLWVNEVADELGLDDRRIALHVLRGVAHALRDRLPSDVVAKLGAQLPVLVRGLYYENWDPHAPRAHRHELEDFAAALERELRGYEQSIGVGEAVNAVLRVLHTHVSPGEWRKLTAVLPYQLTATVGSRNRSEAETPT
jgi:uncharacterized protein (DUF2267 family)